MGWVAVTKDGEWLREDVDGRPVQAGEEGKLLAIMQEDFGHKVAVDLTQGIIFIDYESLDTQNGYLEIAGAKLQFWICDETNIVGQLHMLTQSEPDENGWYTRENFGPTWRPIWFTRYTNGMPTKVIGAQTTLNETFAGKNVKKMVSIFLDGTLGID